MGLPMHAPASAVDENGAFRFGTYGAPIYAPDFFAADLSDCGSFLGGRLGARVRALRLKEWHFIAISGDLWHLAATIAQFGYVGYAVCHVVERGAAVVHTFERTLPWGRGVHFAESSVHGTTFWREGADYMAFEYLAEYGGLWSCTFNLPFSNGRRLKGQVGISPDECVALLYSLDKNRAAYTHKEAGNRAEGLVTFGQNELRFEHDASAVMDWTRSFANRKMSWDWLAVSGRLGDGRRVGLNLSQHIYEDAENYLWLEGIPKPIGAVEFKAAASGGRWRLAGAGAQLTFCPEVEVSTRFARPFVRMDASREFGMLEGSVRVNGTALQLQGLYGVCEHHDAVW